MTSHDDATLPFSERLFEWETHFERVQEITEYDELNKEFNELKGIVINKHEISQEDDKSFFHIIRTQWNWIIRDFSDFYLRKIEERPTKGETFANIIREINSLKMNGQKEHHLGDYETIYKRLQELADDVKESITNEEYAVSQSWRFTWINTIIGFVVGLIAGWVAKMLLG